MQDLTFSAQNCQSVFASNDRSYNFPLQKPMLCPICGAYEDGKTIDRKIYPGPHQVEIGTVAYKCTHCAQYYLAVYKIDKTNKQADFAGFYPPASMEYQNEIIESTSPGFIFSYNQALRAEIRGDIELAAIGFRHSLECLVKDYAIKECGADEAKVNKTKLIDAISQYLEEKDLVSTADVIRILGNDYTHYERKYPQIDFDLLKRYMDIFIKLIETKLLVRHPPVSRQDQSPPASLR